MNAGWKPFPDPESDHLGRTLWLLPDGTRDARLAILDKDGIWRWASGAAVDRGGGPRPTLCHEVVPPVLPGLKADGHPEAGPGPLTVQSDRSELGGYCLTLGPRGGAIAFGMAKPDADLVAELWNDRGGASPPQ